MDINTILRILRLFLLAILMVTLLVIVVLVILIFSVELGVPPEIKFVLSTSDNLVLPISATVLTAIVAIALPLSIQLISNSTKEAFNEGEIGDLIFNSHEYKRLKGGVVAMALVVVVSWLGSNRVMDFLIALLIVWFLNKFWVYIKFLEKYVSDFSGELIKKEQENIDRILDGQS